MEHRYFSILLPASVLYSALLHLTPPLDTLSQRQAAGMLGFKPRPKIKGPAPHSFHLVIYIFKVHLMFLGFVNHLDVSICQPRHLSSSGKKKRSLVNPKLLPALASSHFVFESLHGAAELGSAARRWRCDHLTRPGGALKVPRISVA